MKLKKRIFRIIISIILFIVIVLPCAAIAVIKWAILPPEKLTPIVLSIVNEYINGKIDCEKIELTFYETFPKIGLRLTSGEVISYSLKDSISLAENKLFSTDSLLSFSKLSVSVDIMNYIKNNRLTVDRLIIEDPYFFGFKNEDGAANWNIITEMEPNEENNINLSESGALPIIDIQRLRIKNGRFIYNDCSQDLYTEIDGYNLIMRNKLTKGNLNVDIKTGFNSMFFDSPSYTLNNDLSFHFESNIDLSRGKIDFTNAKLLINDLPFIADGTMEKKDSVRMVDVEFKFMANDLSEILEFIPDEYLNDRKNIHTTGLFKIEGKINGTIGEYLQPNISLKCIIENASLRLKGSEHGIKKLDTDLNLFFNGNNPDSSYVTINKLNFNGTNTSFSAFAQIDNVITNPYIDTYISGIIDLEGLLKDIINPDTLSIKGIMDIDIEAAFNMDEIMDGNISGLKAAGKFNIDRMVVADRMSGFNALINGLYFSADTTKQESRYLNNDDLLSAKLHLDTLSLRYGENISTRIKKLDMEAKTSRTIDTTSVVPVTTHIRMESLIAKLPDSLWISGKNIYLRGGLKASENDKKKAIFAGTISLDTMRYMDITSRTRMSMDNPNFSLEILPLREARRAKINSIMEQQGSISSDSIQPNRRFSQKSSEIRRNSNAERTGANTNDTAPASALRNWEIRGSVKFTAAKLFTSYFPLPMSISNTTIKFNTDKITLTNAELRAGKSDFLLTGEIGNIRRSLLRKDVLQARLSINSNYIDCNQIMRGINNSSIFKVEEFDDDNIENEWNINYSHEITDDNESAGLLAIPENIDFILNTSAKKIDFEDVKLENIEGRAIIRNQSINLRKLKMDSNIGSGNVTMVYTSKNKTQATAGFELELKDIIVERLIGMFPSIDTLLPMLRSFEGVLECQMSATCELDSAMNVIFPTLHAACYLTGENMVLMDGETFSEISKKLMFKNKDRNLIDYISVDLSIKDNKIEIFPFMVELDRYKLAVGGTHNLDMSFDYHVSVLKSPVPFKLGIDIKGNLDDFKFKIVKCKYKKLFTVAREEELQDTRLNLRSAIRETIRKQLTENAPELASGYTEERIRSRRPEIAVQDMDEDDEDTEIDEH